MQTIGSVKRLAGKTSLGWTESGVKRLLLVKCIMRNNGLEQAQAEIKVARRNINKLRYADDTILMAKSEEELKSLLLKVKEESEKVGLNLNIQKAKIMTSGPITSCQCMGKQCKQWLTLFCCF